MKFESNLLDRKPKLVNFVSETYSVANVSHVILCNLMYGTQPITFEWSKNGHKIPINRTMNIKLESTENYSMLTINRLTGFESGTYTCIARNVYGYDLTSTKLHVQCKFIDQYL